MAIHVGSDAMDFLESKGWRTEFIDDSWKATIKFISTTNNPATVVTAIGASQRLYGNTEETIHVAFVNGFDGNIVGAVMELKNLQVFKDNYEKIITYLSDCNIASDKVRG